MAAESRRGGRFAQGEGVLAGIARGLLSVMWRDVRRRWAVRDDVRATLRSWINRLLVCFEYPPDKQLEAIKLVMEHDGIHGAAVCGGARSPPGFPPKGGLQHHYENGEMTTCKTLNEGQAPHVPPTPDHAPQLNSKRLKLVKLRSVNGARIILGTVLAILLLITWIANNPATLLW